MHVSAKYSKTSAGNRIGPYWWLRRSYWGGRKSHKENIAYLGAAPDRRAAYLLARQRGLLCGAHGCYQVPKTRLVLEDGRKVALCADHLHEAICRQDMSTVVPLL